ncbi:hypothetical protein [Paenibacillus sp. NPDC057934]|uniref:hypothetical protein n=1 Tax=Paenibacillus sp. NPDC057934 TaxID=3346282 RepID=UPI0036D77464
MNWRAASFKELKMVLRDSGTHPVHWQETAADSDVPSTHMAHQKEGERDELTT